MPKYFIQSVEEVLKDVKASENGLSSTEANQRLQQFGPNKLPEAKKVSYGKILFNQFTSLLVLILIGAGVISIFFEEYVDAGFIFLIVLVVLVVLVVQI
jgi:Ca2+-transporting ATPase